MVFPRWGCRTCKTRHIKCDGLDSQTTCGRCQKASRTCIWDVNDQAGLSFRNENAFAQGQRRRPKKVNEKEALPPQDIMVKRIQSPKSSPFIPGYIPTALSTPIETQALNYWIRNFHMGLDQLPQFGHEYTMYAFFYFMRSAPDSSLRLASSALSHAVFGRARKASKAIEDADRIYVRSIAKTHEEMGELSQKSIDELLITIMSMSFYENVMYGNQHRSLRQSSSKVADEVGSRLWKSVCHHDGALALLKMRRRNGAPPNLPLDKVVRRQLIRTSILRGIVVPDWIQDGADYCEEGPTLLLDFLMVQVAAVRAKSLVLLSETIREDPFAVNSKSQSWKELAIEAQELDTALAIWSQGLPVDWAFSSHSSATKPTSSLSHADIAFDGTVHVYTTHAHATAWNRYRAVRLIVNSICIRALANQLDEALHPSQLSQYALITTQQKVCQDNIDSLTNDICGSIPFFFNYSVASDSRCVAVAKSASGAEIEIRTTMAGLLAWPLTVAVSTSCVPQMQRQWLRAKLGVAAVALGDAVLESVAEKGEFKF